MASAESMAGFLLEMGLLKRARRTGWWIAGVRDPESIAEHSFRTAMIGTVLAAAEGADPARTSLLCTLHDTQETRVGDIPHNGRPYLTAASNEDVTADQTAALPRRVASVIVDAVAEYEARRTPEAVCARDADKLECLIQAVEYRSQGVSTVGPWIDSSYTALVTETARAIADAVLTADPIGWQGGPRVHRSALPDPTTEDTPT